MDGNGQLDYSIHFILVYILILLQHQLQRVRIMKLFVLFVKVDMNSIIIYVFLIVPHLALNVIKKIIKIYVKDVLLVLRDNCYQFIIIVASVVLLTVNFVNQELRKRFHSLIHILIQFIKII